MNKFNFSEKFSKDIAIIIALSLLITGILNFLFAVNIREKQIIIKHANLDIFNYYAVKTPQGQKAAGLLLVGLPGDTILIYQSVPYRNKYNISPLFSTLFMIELTDKPVGKPENLPISFTFMSFKQYFKLKNKVLIHPVSLPQNFADTTIYPYNKKLGWNKDNFGKLIIPHKGLKLKLNKYAYLLYAPLIEKYENKKIIYKNQKFYLNNKPIEYYTFKYNYYFFLSPNLYIPFDSRSWGPLPKKYIIGKIINNPKVQTALLNINL